MRPGAREDARRVQAKWFINRKKCDVHGVNWDVCCDRNGFAEATPFVNTIGSSGPLSVLKAIRVPAHWCRSLRPSGVSGDETRRHGSGRISQCLRVSRYTFGCRCDAHYVDIEMMEL